MVTEIYYENVMNYKYVNKCSAKTLYFSLKFNLKRNIYEIILVLKLFFSRS